MLVALALTFSSMSLVGSVGLTVFNWRRFSKMERRYAEGAVPPHLPRPARPGDDAPHD